MRIALIGAIVLVLAAGIGATTLSVVPSSDNEPLRPIQVTAPQVTATPPPAADPAPPTAEPAPVPRVTADQQGVPPPPLPAHTQAPTVNPGVQGGGADRDDDDDDWDDDDDRDDDWDDDSGDGDDDDD
ncbi:MAG: hypothetical protein WBB00_30705 [Mycobacterium sp.]